MKSNIKKLAVPSLLLGIIITALFMTQMKWTSGECGVFQGFSKSWVVCSNMSYGYPAKFIQTSTFVNVSNPEIIGTSASIQIKPSGLIWNISLWTLASLGALSLLTTNLKPKSSKSVRSKSTKKKK